jgi:hypothetical protein
MEYDWFWVILAVGVFTTVAIVPLELALLRMSTLVGFPRACGGRQCHRDSYAREPGFSGYRFNYQ